LIAIGALREFEPTKPHLKSQHHSLFSHRQDCSIFWPIGSLNSFRRWLFNKMFVNINSSQVGLFFCFPASSIRQIKLVVRFMALCVYPVYPFLLLSSPSLRAVLVVHGNHLPLYHVWTSTNISV
jgi:hypothetical protein